MKKLQNSPRVNAKTAPIKQLVSNAIKNDINCIALFILYLAVNKAISAITKTLMSVFNPDLTPNNNIKNNSAAKKTQKIQLGSFDDADLLNKNFIFTPLIN